MRELFQFYLPPWELVVRGSLIYWFLFLLFRFVLRRDAGSLGLADVLVVVLIADAAQNGMSGGYKSVGEAMVLIATIAAWNYMIDWLSFRFEWFARFAEPRSIPLIRKGQLLESTLRKQMLTKDELLSQLRQNGVEQIEEVKLASLEPDGHISVIRFNGGQTSHRTHDPPGTH